jgi:hypothetical protein
MHNLHRKHRLFATALLFSGLANLGSSPSFAADGSQRLPHNSPHASVNKLQKLAEDGSERSSRFRLEHDVYVAEGGADRIQLIRKA